MAGWARLPGARARCEPRGASATTRSVLHRCAARRAASARGAAANSYTRQRALTHGRCAPPNSRTCPCRFCSAPLAPLACTARQPLCNKNARSPVCAPKEPPNTSQMTLLDLQDFGPKFFRRLGQKALSKSSFQVVTRMRSKADDSMNDLQ